MPTAIEICNVHKTFRKKVRALRGVSMRVDHGQIFCLLGPNGAGKSTLVKILMTVIHASRISGTMLGRPIGHKATLRRVGYLPEHHRFPIFMTAEQALHFYGALSGMRRRARRRRIDAMLDLVGMTGWRKHRVGTFSKGMQQRIGIAQALLHDPELLLLDEPTDGVDPIGRREIRDLLVQLRDEGRTILINSHILSELETICDQLAVVVKGRVSLEGTVDELTSGRRRWVVAYEGAGPEWIEEETRKDGRLTQVMLPGADAAEVQPIIDRIRQAGCTITAVSEVRESLEDLFMRALVLAGEDEGSTPGAAKGEDA
ncbi:MAG: ABC transporter ATP-binding protein [Phycisphaerales bacterium]|jgi:ABC-2 type transport system ATP-binding protein|nr:ABC transporter ATP-binding protein [Phycisphaerales bacterium]